MINLLSVTDGFKVILGSFLLHFAALATMIISVRPPEYDDSDRTSGAQVIYYTLIAMHLVLGVVKYITTFVNDSMLMINAIFMLSVVFILACLCEDWIFPPEAINWHSITDEQR